MLEIGTKDVKYKRWSNQDGPTYTILQSDIKSITYKSGDVDTFDKKSESEINTNNNSSISTETSTFMSENLAISNQLQREALYAKGKTWRIIGDVSSTTCIVGGLCLYILADAGFGVFLGSMAIGCLTEIVCFSIGNNYDRAADAIVELPVMKYKLNLGTTNDLFAGISVFNNSFNNNNGLGLSLSFSF